MKSTLVNMVAVLFTITLVASAGVGYVNMITVGPRPRLLRPNPRCAPCCRLSTGPRRRS